MSTGNGSIDSSSDPQPRRRHPSQCFETSTFIAISVEGILALALGLSIPSEEGSSVVLGFSLLRLTLFSAVLAGALLPAALSIRIITNPVWFDHRNNRVQLWLFKSDRAFWILFFALASAGVSIVTLVFYFTFGGYVGSTENAILQRTWPFIAWFGLTSLHASSLVARSTREALTRSRDLQHPRLTTSVVVLLVVALSFAHWFTLRYSLPVFTSIPDWHWTPFTWYGLNSHLYVPIIVAAYGAVYLLIRHEWRLRYTLILIVGLALLLQLSVGFVRGSGIDSLRKHYLRLGQSYYAKYVSDDNASMSDILHYDEKFRDNFYLGTKPPGYLLGYMTIRAAVDVITPASTYDERLESITRVISVLFPIIASLALMPVYALARMFGTPDVGRITCALYVTAPSFILMALRLDQALFPALFATGLLLVVIAFRNRNGWFAIAAGAFAYCSVYVSFSLIPLVPLCVTYLLIAQLRATGRVHPLGQFRLVYLFVFGVALTTALLALFLKFDITSRFTGAIAIHKEVMRTASQELVTPSGLLLNNVEFSSWIGSALALMSLAGILIIARTNGSREALSLRPLLLSGGVAWLLLNVLGQTRGETGRLWLFFLPLVALCAAHAVHAPKLRVPKLLALIAAVQTTTALLILQYQFAR